MRKMVMAVVPRDQADSVMESLIAAGYTATFTDSHGGMLRQAQQMLFIAVRERDLERILAIIRDNCRTKVEVESAEERTPSGLIRRSERVTTYVGSAVIFVWDLERFETY